MRIKKILSLAVVLAMVLTVVPMFGITASAASEEAKLELSTTEFISAIGEKPEALVFDGSYTKVQATDSGDCEAVSNKYTGWSATYSTDDQSYSTPSNLRFVGLCNYNTVTVADNTAKKRNYIKFQRYGMAGLDNGNEIEGDNKNQFAKVTAPESVYNASSKDVFVIDYTLKHNLGESSKVQNKENIVKDDLYGTFLFSDANDQTFAVVWMDGKKSHNGDNDGTIKYDTYGLVSREKDALYRIMVVNDTETDTHSLYYEADLDGNGFVLQKRANGLEGTVKGFKELKVSRPNYNDQDTFMAIGDLKIYAADLSDLTTADVTVQYTDDSNVVGSYKVKKLVGSSYAPAVSDYYINDDENAVYKVTDKNIRAVTVEAGGTTISVPVTKFRNIVGTNLATNGSFESNNFEGWTSSSGQAVNSGKFSITKDASKGRYAVSTVKSNSNSDAETIKNAVKISETGTYFISVDVKGTYKSNSGAPATQYMWLSVDSRHLGGDTMAMNTSSFTTYSYVEPVSKNSEVSVEGQYFQDYHPIIDNFVVYKLAPEENEKSLTVEYQVDGETMFTDGGVYTPETVAAGVYYDAKYYYDSAKGTMYSAPAKEYTKDATVSMDAESTKFHIGNMTYNVSDGNIVTNGTFDDGTTGWKAGANYGTDLADSSISSKFEVLATDGDHKNTLKMTGNEGSGGASTLHTYWNVEPGQTYYFAYDTIKDESDKSDKYGGITMLKSGKEAAVADKAKILYARYNCKTTDDKVGIADDSSKNNWYKVGNTWDRKAYIITIPEGADGLGFRVGYSKAVRIDNVVLYKLEGQSLPDVTVTLKDSDGQQVVETLRLKARGYDGKKVVVAKGIYNKQYHLDKDVVASTTGGLGALAAEVNVTGKLDKFSWDTKNNYVAFIGDYSTYNSAHVVTWNPPTSDIVSYAYVTIPEKTDKQQYVINIEAKWPFGTDNRNATGAKIELVTNDVASVKDIDLTTGADATAALNALNTEVVLDSVTFTPEDYNGGDKTGTDKIAVPTESKLKSGEAVLKLSATTARGICTINKITVTAEDIVPSVPVAELGYENNAFTINFKYGDIKGDTIKVHSDASDPAAEFNESKQTNDGVTLSTSATNRNYTATAVNGTAESEGVVASIYELVVKAIAEETGDMKADKLAAANKVIAAGGILSTDTIDDVRANIIEKNGNVANSIKVKQEIFDKGIGFTVSDGKIYVGSEVEANVSASGTDTHNGVYQYMKIDETQKTVTLSNDAAFTQEAVTLSLDSVNIEFVETLVEEFEADNADADVDFIPEL